MLLYFKHLPSSGDGERPILEKRVKEVVLHPSVHIPCIPMSDGPGAPSSSKEILDGYMHTNIEGLKLHSGASPSESPWVRMIAKMLRPSLTQTH